MLFANDQTEGQTTAETQTQEDWLAKVVEVKGEKFRDVNVLAKSKLESDNYIKELERQLKEMREEVGKQDYASKLLETLQSKATPQTGTPSDTKPDVSEDVIKSLVEQTLTKREKENTAAQNLKLAQQELASRYGTEAQARVTAKANELGISMERLSELASESPTAFLALLGEKPTQPVKPPVQGTLNTSAPSFQAPNDRDWNYYRKLRKENPSQYFNPKTQQQLMQDKMRLGDKFGI